MLATVDPPLTRDARRVEENCRLIVAFLRSPAPRAFSVDDAAATCSAGYSAGIEIPHNPRDKQPMGYEELIRWGHLAAPTVTQYDPEPDDGPPPPECPRWEQDVVRQEERARKAWEKRHPLFLREGVPKALVRLCPLDREIVDLCGRQWHTFRAAGEMLRPKRAHSNVSNRYWAALHWIESIVFDDEGAGRLS